jgi:hypothetical protein
MERLRGEMVDENGMLNDILLFLRIFGEIEIDLGGVGKSCFKST